MVPTLIVIGVLIVVFVLLELKTSRPDGTYLERIHPYRKLMLYIMPGRNESVVYYDRVIQVEKLLEYIEAAKKADRFHLDVTHCLVAGIANGFRETPSMNRFTVGRRLYMRDATWISFSMKRQKLGRKAKLAVVKKMIPAEMTFKDLCEDLQAKIEVERSDKKTYLDKELSILGSIPRPLLRFGVKFLNVLNYYNLLPAGFIKNDAMFTSIFVANLGSLGMHAGYHHLYEWGTSPLFCMIGAIEERPVVEDGQVVVRKIIPLRFSYDERTEDGLNAGDGIGHMVKVIENPFQFLGCLAEDGSEDFPIGQPGHDVDALAETADAVDVPAA